jgi:hypothetical protein
VVVLKSFKLYYLQLFLEIQYLISFFFPNSGYQELNGSGRTYEKLVDLAEEKWFDPQNPKKTDPRLLVFLTAARRFPFEAGDTSAPDERVVTKRRKGIKYRML